MAEEFALGNEIVDFDLLRRLGVLPLNPGDTTAAIPEFPTINIGPQFGRQMEAELGGPYGMMPSGEQRSPLDSTVQESPAASMPVGGGGGQLQPSGQYLPWTTPEGIAKLPIMQQGEQRSISAPEGTASWMPANPADTQNWVQQKLAEQTANREAAGRRAEVQAKLEIYKQRQVEQQQQMARELQMNQQLQLQELARRNPVEFLNQTQKLQASQAAIAQAQAAQQTEGSAESQAFRQIVAKEGLNAGLQWLQQNDAQKQRLGATPEQRYLNTLAETMGRYGGVAQGLRAQVAQGNAAATIAGQLQPVAGGQPGVSGVAAIEQARAGAKPVPTSERVDLAAMSNVMGIINDIESNWDTVKQFVGPVRGRAGAIGERFGGVLGIPEVSPEEANYRAATQDANNRMIYFLSGKQINKEEAERLGLVMPSMDLPEVTYLARLKRFQQNIGKLMNARISLQTASASDIRSILGGGVVTSQTSTPSPAAAPAGLPPASSYPGKTGRDTVTGKRYRSDGINWTEIP